MHPNGEEWCFAPMSMTLIQEFPDGSTQRTELTAGEYAVNPYGTPPIFKNTLHPLRLESARSKGSVQHVKKHETLEFNWRPK